ncbi:MAG TPA: ABC transporter permease, partial [Gammaproteobacteria bacterium]
MRHTLRLAARLLRRDWRAGELQALLFALAIAAATSTAITAFSERLKLAFADQTGELLGADLVVESSRPTPDAWLAAAEQRGLRNTAAVEFASMAVADSGLQLVAVKAVGDGYPLRGAVRVATVPYGEETAATHMPEPGTLWLESRLFTLLGLRIGDRLRIGDADFRIAQALG